MVPYDVASELENHYNEVESLHLSARKSLI